MAAGSRWACRRTAATAFRKRSSTACPASAPAASYEVVKGLAIDEFSRGKMDNTLKELLEERDGVKHLLG